MKVRITATPREDEIDGVRLDNMERGTVREVSPTIGAWLVAEGYAVPEMRHADDPYDRKPLMFNGKALPRESSDDRPRRRADD